MLNIKTGKREMCTEREKDTELISVVNRLRKLFL